MRKIILSATFAFALLGTSTAVAQQGFGTNTPDRSSAIEIKSTNKGLLIPRIALTSETDQTTINNPANSLLIYNTSIASGLNAGYYYWNAITTKWIPFVDTQNQEKATVTAGQNIKVDPTVNGTVTDYKVSVLPGTDKQFLATKLVSGELETVWVNYADIIEVENGLTKGADGVVRLGGDLTGHTTIDTKTFDLFIRGLSSTTDMTNKVIAVGDATTGKVEVATPETIVSAGLTHNLTSAVNTMTSTINGIDKDADIINSNDLSIETGSTVLKSTVNGVEDTQDLKDAIQAGQKTYEVKSTDASVGITATPTGNHTVYDLQVTGVNAGIVVKNGITKDTSNGDVILGGDLDRNTTINTRGYDVKIEGLSQVTSMENQVIAVGHETTGLVKVATPEQIVAAGITAANGLKINTTTPSEVNLGGALKEATTITTTATNTLAIAGLQAADEEQKNKVIVSESGVLRTVERVVKGTNVEIAANTGYSLFAPEVVINVTLDPIGDKTIVFPDAKDAVGQTISVKIANTDDTHTGYLNILNTYGSMPYQGWVVKSNGTDWVIVGRN